MNFIGEISWSGIYVVWKNGITDKTYSHYHCEVANCGENQLLTATAFHQTYQIVKKNANKAKK